MRLAGLIMSVIAPMALAGCASRGDIAAGASGSREASGSRLAAAIPAPPEIGHSVRPALAKVLGRAGAEGGFALDGSMRSPSQAPVVVADRKAVVADKRIDPSEFDPNRIYR